VASSRRAVAGSNPTSTTASGTSGVATTPTTVAVRGSPPDGRTRTRSPTPNPCSRAVVWSTTTSPGPVGTRPARRLPANDGSIERPSGARTPTTWPSRPSSWALPLITPVATATPSTRSARPTAEAGIGLANSSPVMSEKISPSPVGAARTTTSTLGAVLVKAASAAASAVSVSTNVPATTPTPSMTASTVSSRRPLYAHRLVRV
jgi:hypothetical protein